MEIDWSTFVLEVLNFLVLVWLLKRFFYRPVLAIIEQRRAETAKAIANAEALRREAEALKAEYQTQLASMEEVRTATKHALDEEIAAERARRQRALDAEIETERARREALEARARTEREAALERQALALAARFASRLLERVASPELTALLTDLALEELDARPPAEVEALSTALHKGGASIRVISAHPLDAARRAAFTEALGRLAGRSVTPEFSEDPMLKAGVCIMAGSWVLMANLRDELGFFTGSLEHGG